MRQRQLQCIVLVHMRPKGSALYGCTRDKVHSEWLNTRVSHSHLKSSQHVSFGAGAWVGGVAEGAARQSERPHLRVEQHVREDAKEALTETLAAEEDVDGHDTPDNDQLTRQEVLLLKGQPGDNGEVTVKNTMQMDTT